MVLEIQIDRDAILSKRGTEEMVLSVSLAKYSFELAYQTALTTIDELRKHFGIVCSLRRDRWYENLLICTPKETWNQFNRYQLVGYAQGYSAHVIKANLERFSFLPEQEEQDVENDHRVTRGRKAGKRVEGSHPRRKRTASKAG